VHRSRTLPFLLLLAFGPFNSVKGHTVEQFYAEITPASDGIEVLFDLGYALPGSRNDEAAPQPKRSWLLNRSPTELDELRKGSEAYLRECLSFTRAKTPVEAHYRFVDFEQEPPVFHDSLIGGAYFRILITPDAPYSSAPITCHLETGDRPNFVIKTPATEATYLTLKPGESFPLIGSSGKSFTSYAWSTGFAHVLPMGLDHLCFILGLFLFQRSLRPLLYQSLAFTAAHTLTLGLSAAHMIPKAGPWVEILIPLSIAALAIENIREKGMVKYRIILVFSFGLIHGVGFASALQRLFPEGDSFLPFLILTNLGIESAQVVILVAAWFLTAPFSRRKGYGQFRCIANIILLLVALSWTIQRLIEVGGN
jgi:hydrogenase/urease accessory protein HupE